MSKLYEEYETKQFGKLPNRCAVAALTRARSSADGLVNDIVAKYYTQRANVGVLLSEGTHMSLDGRGFWKAPGIYNKSQVEAWKRVTKAVHDASPNTAFVCQLWHTGRASHSDYQPEGKAPFAPSAISINESFGDVHVPGGEKKPHEVPRAMTIEDIERTIKEYEVAAQNAREAGFDGVMIHGANGYLLDTFLQSSTNTRTDEYGGSIEKRITMLKRVIESIEKVYHVSKISVKLSPNGGFNDMGSVDNLEQFDATIKYLCEVGVGFIEIMDGLAFGFHEKSEPYTLERAREIVNKYSKSKGSTILMANCGYTKESAVKAVEAGTADMVSFGRPTIANPDFVHRFKNNIPLTEVEGRDHWYMPGEDIAKGYTDFPAAL